MVYPTSAYDTNLPKFTICNVFKLVQVEILLYYNNFQKIKYNKTVVTNVKSFTTHIEEFVPPAIG